MGDLDEIHEEQKREISGRERVAREASIEDLLIAVATPDMHVDSVVRQTAWDEIKRRLSAAHGGLKRALDYRAATPEGLAIKDDVRKALTESGCPANEWGEVGS